MVRSLLQHLISVQGRFHLVITKAVDKIERVSRLVARLRLERLNSRCMLKNHLKLVSIASLLILGEVEPSETRDVINIDFNAHSGRSVGRYPILIKSAGRSS